MVDLFGRSLANCVTFRKKLIRRWWLRGAIYDVNATQRMVEEVDAADLLLTRQMDPYALRLFWMLTVIARTQKPYFKLSNYKGTPRKSFADSIMNGRSYHENA